MKSLEIVNKWVTQLEEIKKCIEEDINEGLSWFNYEKLYKYLEDAEKIKQDLEVFEILTKSYIVLSITPARNEWLWKLDFENYITKKDAMKVKQWLEENK